MYTPVNQFYYIKVGVKGVKIIYACFRDVSEIIHAMRKWTRLRTCRLVELHARSCLFGFVMF